MSTDNEHDFNQFQATSSESKLRCKKLPEELHDAVVCILERHGVTITREVDEIKDQDNEHMKEAVYDILHLPEGSTLTHLLPIIIDTRYNVTLPDGYQFLAVHNSFSDTYGLGINADDFPEHLRRKYK